MLVALRGDERAGDEHERREGVEGADQAVEQVEDAAEEGAESDDEEAILGASSLSSSSSSSAAATVAPRRKRRNQAEEKGVQSGFVFSFANISRAPDAPPSQHSMSVRSKKAKTG